jgi:hypothetical protein
MQLLSFIQKFALLAARLKWLVWVLAALSLVCFAYLVLAADPELDPFILPSMVALGWAICLLGIASNFREVPQRPEPGTRFFRRIRMRISYGIAWFWAAVFVLCSLILVYLSIRSVSLIFLG